MLLMQDRVLGETVSVNLVASWKISLTFDTAGQHAVPSMIGGEAI